MNHHDILIHINKYGPIENETIKMAPMLLMTGNSNLGKSYVNYLCYFFMRALSWDMFYGLVNKKIGGGEIEKSDYFFKITENDMRKWLIVNVQPFLASFLGNENLICDVSFDLGLDQLYKDGEILINYHREYQEQLKDDLPKNLICSVNIAGENSSWTILGNDKRNELQQLAQGISIHCQKKMFNNVFLKGVILPPARGSYVGESFSAKEMIASQAGMYRAFLNDYDLALHGVEHSLTQEEQFFRARVKDLVGGDLETKDNKQYLVMSNGINLPITAAASSIKELSPFLFFLKNWSRYQFSFCIEEPEAHLHPSMQVKVADLLAACINKGMFLQMTTHSDYFVHRINQLILLGDLKKKDPVMYENFRSEHKLNKRFYLDPGDVSCYYFYEYEGKVKIECLQIEEEQGLPMKTFYSVVETLSDFDEDLSIAFDKKSAKDGK